MRALLRMVRTELGDFFEDENIRLGEAAHNLSELRDASALIGALNNLRQRRKDAALKKPLVRVGKLFDLQKRQLEEQAATRKLFPGVAVELRKTRRSIRSWPLKEDGFRAIAPGVEATFRNGRKAMTTAAAAPSTTTSGANA